MDNATVAMRRGIPLRRVGVLLAGAILSAGLCGWIVCAPGPRPQGPLPDLPDLAGKNDLLKNLLLEADREARAVGSGAAVGKLARVYHANLYYAQAATCYRLAEQREPDNPRWPYLHAAALQSLGVSDGVATLLRRTITLDGRNVPALLRLAELELKLEQRQEARADFERILAVDPNNAYAHLGLARVAMAASDSAAAREYLERAVQIDPGYGTAYRLLAGVYEQIGEKELAARTAAAANMRGRIREFPDPWVGELYDLCYDVAYLMATEVTRVVNPQRAGDWRIDMLRRIVRCAPDNAEAHLYLGQALSQPETMAEAGRHLQEAVRLDPKLAWARCMLGNWLALSGQPDRAAEQFDAAIKLDPESPSAILMLAKLRLGQERHEEAADLFRQGLDKADRARIPMVRLYVEALNRLGREKEAVQFVNQLITRHPTIGCLWEYLSDVAAQDGAWEEAEAMLRRGLAAAPYNAIIAERLAWRLATSPRATPESGEEAIHWAQVAMETGDPQDASCHPDVALAAAYARAGRFDEATAIAQRSLAAARAMGDERTMRDLTAHLRYYAARQPLTVE